tara:strand:- start:8 stop:238 length:231 start_codon:yes stop_codon:yes gene_type:complete
MCFGPDWTGLFIRGDHVKDYAMAIVRIISDPETARFELDTLRDLVTMMSAVDERSASHRTSLQRMRPFPECRLEGP